MERPKPREPGKAELEAFRRLERDGWERVAEPYCRTWRDLTRQFVEPLLDFAAIGEGTRLLDLACGPGDLAAAATSRGARACGLDLSRAMVRLARLLYPGIEFRRGDAEHLKLASGSFDRVVMSFGILHLARPELALAEACWVLRPGGRLVFSLWEPPAANPGVQLVEDALERHAEGAEQLPAGPSSFLLADPDEARRALSGAGFEPRSVRSTSCSVLWRIPTPSFLFEAEREGGVRTAAVLSSQPPARLREIRRAIEEAAEAFVSGDGYAIPFAARLVSAMPARADGRGKARSR